MSNFHSNHNHNLPMQGLKCQIDAYLTVPRTYMSLHKAHMLLAASVLFLGFHCLAYKRLQNLDYSCVILLHQTHASVTSLRLYGILLATPFINSNTKHLLVNLAVSKQMPGNKMIIITIICTILKSINLLIVALGNEHSCSKITIPFYIK